MSGGVKMKVTKVDVNRMCDHGTCHERCQYEILLGGYKNRILLCENCYKQLKKCIKEEEKLSAKENKDK